MILRENRGFPKKLKSMSNKDRHKWILKPSKRDSSCKEEVTIVISKSMGPKITQIRCPKNPKLSERFTEKDTVKMVLCKLPSSGMIFLKLEKSLVRHLWSKEAINWQNVFKMWIVNYQQTFTSPFSKIKFVYIRYYAFGRAGYSLLTLALLIQFGWKSIVKKKNLICQKLKK
jgi:hypothetical protein